MTKSHWKPGPFVLHLVGGQSIEIIDDVRLHYEGGYVVGFETRGDHVLIDPLWEHVVTITRPATAVRPGGLVHINAPLLAGDTRLREEIESAVKRALDRSAAA